MRGPSLIRSNRPASAIKRPFDAWKWLPGSGHSQVVRPWGHSIIVNPRWSAENSFLMLVASWLPSQLSVIV